MDGLEALRRLRAKSDVAAILLSSKQNVIDERVFALKTVADDFQGLAVRRDRAIASGKHKRHAIDLGRTLKPRKYNANPETRARQIERVIAPPSVLLQINWLIFPSFVELCTPYLVHALVVGATEDHGRAEPYVEVAQIFQSPD